MRKIGVLMLALLSFYCAFLTFQINELKKRISDGTEETVHYVNKTVTGFSTDLTKVVDQVSSQIVQLDIVYPDGTATGSGVIYSAEAERTLIVTSIQGMDEVLSLAVTFANGESVSGELIGVDPLTNLSVISTVPSFSSVPIAMADTSMLSLGEWLIAIGSHARNDLLPSISVGVLSGKNRSAIETDAFEQLDDFPVFTADLIITEGISGGAVVNMQGEMVGMPSVSLSKDGQCSVIPVEEVEEVVRIILEHGIVQRPVLGVSTLSVAEMTAYQKSQLGIQLDQIEGLYVKNVSHGGACDLAGLQEGDILLEFNGIHLMNYNTLRSLLYSQMPQEQIELTVLRGADQMKAVVTLQ